MSDCCSETENRAGSVTRISGDLSLSDKLGMVRCRLSNKTRSDYRVEPGLYALGVPGNLSPVFASANYKYSFDILRSALQGVDCYILVLDTKGINVWCAAGKGTFGTDEMVRQIEGAKLADIVEIKRIVVPQLGAVGIAAHIVKERTGFAVRYGPVDARDLPEYINLKMKATPEMRHVRFSLWDRFVLSPMEFVPAAKKLLPLTILLFAVAGLSPGGIMFEPGLRFISYAGTALAAAWLTGSFIGPILLPVLPSRSFAVKGGVLGLLYPLILLIWFLDGFTVNPFLFMASALSVPLLSSYLLLLFTGSTTITGISGVKKELAVALPLYKIGAAICGVLTVVAYLRHWAIV